MISNLQASKLSQTAKLITNKVYKTENLHMNNRSQSGASLAFVVSGMIVLLMIGYCFFVLSLQMGGSRELLQATDAGSLNVAKQATRHPDVAFSATEESQNFQGLIDKGQVSLANYNRIVAQTLLVALNAQAEGTVAARANAERLIDVVQGSGGIGSRLKDALSNPSKMEDHFTALAVVNSVRMLGSQASTKSDNKDYGVAYLEESNSSNVDFDPATLPYASDMTKVALPGGSTSSEKSKKRSFSYLAGYSPIKVPGISKMISAVPVMPGQAPHLVSLKDFNANRVAPKGITNVPPNSFKTAGAALTSHGVACSLVGVLDTDFTAAIPRGYIVIHNGPAASFNGRVGDADQIFAKELMTGIFVGPGTGTQRAFTTDGALYSQWLNYNTARLNGTTPLPPPPPKTGIHGDPLSITKPATQVTYLDYDSPPSPTAGAMLGSFQDAYPHANAGTEVNANDLTSVELFKAKVGEAFGRVTRLHDPTDPMYRQNIPAPAIVTGMKAFDHNAVYSAGPPSFGKVGSLKQFLLQCNAGSVLMQIEQRLHQIKPEATDAERQAVLNAAVIGMGQTLYIYKGSNNKLTINSQKPSWVTDVVPDGQQQSLSSSYSLINKTVNSVLDYGAPVYPFMHAPASMGHDSCIYTPSSGYRNLLGEMTFSNSSSGGGDFWDPN
ncbi:MAG: hypothetical protein K2X29_08740 [Candidatus Obscuribacterales bacterium]|nr:hypothetical protein [Candidatus Obscuribacterales bacterium]